MMQCHGRSWSHRFRCRDDWLESERARGKTGLSLAIHNERAYNLMEF